MKILTSRSYALFTADETNRSVTKKNLKKIHASMARYGWLPAYPMHVIKRDGRLVIIDGQHRFSAAKSLDFPVQYVIDSERGGMSIGDIQGNAWAISDYVNSYAQQGNKHYVHLRAFCERHKLPVGIGAKLLIQSNNRDTGTYPIRNGTFAVKNASSAERVANIATRVRAKFKQGCNSSFVDALMKACTVDGFNDAQFVQRCDSYPFLLTAQPTTGAYLEMIETIYNYKTNGKNKLPVKFLAMNAK